MEEFFLALTVVFASVSILACGWALVDILIGLA